MEAKATRPVAVRACSICNGLDRDGHGASLHEPQGSADSEENKWIRQQHGIHNRHSNRDRKKGCLYRFGLCPSGSKGAPLASPSPTSLSSSDSSSRRASPSSAPWPSPRCLWRILARIPRIRDRVVAVWLLLASPLAMMTGTGPSCKMRCRVGRRWKLMTGVSR